MIIAMNRLDPRSHILSTIGQETRIAIVELLRHGERCVCEIFPAIGHEQSNVSRHLNLMVSAGLLSRRKEGAKIFYALSTPEVLGLLDLAGRIAGMNGR